MLGELIGGFWGYLAAAVAAAAGVGITLFGRSQKIKGRQETYIEAKARDHEKASEIRDRVEHDLDDRVRRFDDAGYRD
ncbi:hypothetical protein [Leisingera sp. M523]|uniref:hypothetical protein n=1 Tax=Leisingera sp. M523 TaxID=2867013 RepID=UPI0021A57035|nr:hypothetical protein [Leisingera sp. M523]UWQ30265.1 hypothetical protein K3557_06930 [Leisingera sp. M523]